MAVSYMACYFRKFLIVWPSWDWLSTPIGHRLGNRRYNEWILKVVDNTLMNLHLIACDHCNDTGNMTVYDVCDHCFGKGCDHCVKGQVKSVINCINCEGVKR